MPDPFAHPKAGDPLNINAQGYSAALDAGKAHLRHVHRLTRGPQTASTPRAITFPMKNTTESDLNRWAVLGIDDPLFTVDDNTEQFQNHILWKGVTPTIANHYRKFAILQEPAKAGNIAEALFVGLTVAKIDVTNEQHKWADVKDNNRDTLASAAAGFARILWKESGTGTKLAYIEMGAPPLVAVPAVIIAQLGDGGMYSAAYGVPKTTALVTSGTWTWTGRYDFPDHTTATPELVILNDAEENKSRHDLSPGTRVRVYLTDEPACDLGLPVYSTNYNHAVRNVKWFDATGELKQTFEDKEDPDTATYELITDFTNCP